MIRNKTIVIDGKKIVGQQAVKWREVDTIIKKNIDANLDDCNIKDIIKFFQTINKKNKGKYNNIIVRTSYTGYGDYYYYVVGTKYQTTKTFQLNKIKRIKKAKEKIKRLQETIKEIKKEEC